MILLNRLEKYAAQIGFFSEMQFGFQEGVGFNEVSFTILKTITCWSIVAKFSAVFSMFAKLLIQSGLMGFFANYFQVLVLEVGCGWPQEIYTQMSKHKFF